jgi:hypothetical protein
VYICEPTQNHTQPQRRLVMQQQGSELDIVI